MRKFREDRSKLRWVDTGFGNHGLETTFLLASYWFIWCSVASGTGFELCPLFTEIIYSTVLTQSSKLALELWLLNTRAVRSYYCNLHRNRFLRCVFPKVQSQCSSSVATPFRSGLWIQSPESLKIFQELEGCSGTSDVQKKFSWPRITVLTSSSPIFGTRGWQPGLRAPPTAAGPNVQVPNIYRSE